MKNKENDMMDFTQGSILKKLLRFMVPILGALILQAAYGAVDLLVVGLSLIHISEPTRPY